MQRILNISIITAACALLALSATQSQAADKKADPTGTWTWTTPGRQGGEARTNTLKLKLEGDKLTGAVSGGFGRQRGGGDGGGQGGQPRETAISDGKITGDEISFKVTREFNNNSFTQTYKGKLSGDTITGKIEFERGGETQSRDWEAKRQKAEKKTS